MPTPNPHICHPYLGHVLGEGKRKLTEHALSLGNGGDNDDDDNDDHTDI